MFILGFTKIQEKYRPIRFPGIKPKVAIVITSNPGWPQHSGGVRRGRGPCPARAAAGGPPPAAPPPVAVRSGREGLAGDVVQAFFEVPGGASGRDSPRESRVPPPGFHRKKPGMVFVMVFKN